VLVGSPGAAQDRLPADVADTRRGSPGVPRRPGKNAELLVLCHKNALLRRHVGRVRYGPTTGCRFAALARLLPSRRWRGIFR
jgi:hypothetical protein